MKIRAIALSILAHGAVLGGALCLGLAQKGQDRASEPVVEAPLGSVFVKEQSEGNGKNEGREKAGAKALGDSIVLQAPQSHSSPESQSAIGLPSGEAEPLGKIEPTYPAMSRKLGEEGEVVFNLNINADGSVSQIAILKSSGHARLDEAAQAALKEAKFSPAHRDGSNQESRKQLRVEFRLR